MSKEKHCRSLSYSLLFLILLTRGWYLEALLLKNPLQAACSRGPDLLLVEKKQEKERIFLMFMKAAMEMAVKM